MSSSCDCRTKIKQSVWKSLCSDTNVGISLASHGEELQNYTGTLLEIECSQIGHYTIYSYLYNTATYVAPTDLLESRMLRRNTLRYYLPTVRHEY